MKTTATFKSKFVKNNEINIIKENYRNYFNKFSLLLDTPYKKSQFKKIGDFLTVVLRTRYAGFTGNCFLKLYNAFRVVNITIDFVELLLQRIDINFDTIDAKALIALASHRTASYFLIETSYPNKLQKLYNAINIQVNSSSLEEVSERTINDIYYVNYIIEEFCNDKRANTDLLLMILRNLQEVAYNTDVHVQKYVISLLEKKVFGNNKEIIDEIIKLIKNISITSKELKIKLAIIVYFNYFVEHDNEKLCKSIFGVNTELTLEQMIKNSFLERINSLNKEELVAFNIINYQYSFNNTKDTNRSCYICLEEFKNEQKVLKLFSNEQKYFLYHYDCIYSWLMTNPTDPITRKAPRFI